MENQKCSDCKCVWKPEDTDIKSSGLYYKCCKICRNKQKQHREDNREAILKRSEKFRQNNKQTIRDYRKKYRNANREKISQDFKRYRKDNVEYLRKYYQQYRKDNIEKLSEKGRQWYNDNKEKAREYRKHYLEIRKQNYHADKCPHERNKYQCKECNFKKYLIHLQRNRLRRCFKISNLKKTKPSIEYLGCSIEYFMEYFKKKMAKFNLFSEIEMTWDNIHVDHIKPMSVFDLDNQDEFLFCCSYTNLQPLLAEMNQKKNNKWNDVSNDFWLTSIINNEDADIYIP